MYKGAFYKNKSLNIFINNTIMSNYILHIKKGEKSKKTTIEINNDEELQEYLSNQYTIDYVFKEVCSEEEGNNILKNIKNNIRIEQNVCVYLSIGALTFLFLLISVGDVIENKTFSYPRLYLGILAIYLIIIFAKIRGEKTIQKTKKPKVGEYFRKDLYKMK